MNLERRNRSLGMDTSRTYIKMCDCEEIQGESEYDDRDFFVHTGNTELANELSYHSSEYMKSMNDLHRDREYIWLPRQDQIQEMFELPPIGDERFQVITPLGFAYKLYDFAEEIRNPNKKYPYGSMEQLWLAFYMHEKHNKRWDGITWKA